MFVEIDGDSYKAFGGTEGTLMRESGRSPNGNSFGNRWVLRDRLGWYVDHDQFRTDLAERNKLTLLDRDVVELPFKEISHGNSR
jgi:hypothetical protein